MKMRHTTRSLIVSGLLLAGLVRSAVAAWQPGLQGGTVSGSFNTTAMPAVTNVYSGPHAGATQALPPWAANTTWVYWGEIYLGATNTWFAENIDDAVYMRIWNGETATVVLNNSLHSTPTAGSFTAPAAGWYPVEIRLGNGTGGAGPYAYSGWTSTKGFGYKIGGESSVNGADYTYPEDDGLMSLFRHDDGLGFDDALVVAGSPGNYGTVSPPYGMTEGLETGDSLVCSAPTGAVDIATGIRAHCLGFQLYTNTSVPMLAASGTTNAFVYTHDLNARLVWQWQKSYKIIFGAETGGTVSTTGGWYVEGSSVTVTATPADGYVFVFWEGDVPEASRYDATLELPSDQPRTLTASFRFAGAGADKYWIGATAGGDGVRWDIAPNWDPAGVPTSGDNVIITNGAPLVTDTASARSITITNGTLTVSGGTEYAHVAVSVAEDLTLLAGATMSVTAGRASNPTNHAAIYAEANKVTVGGTMRIALGGVFTPIADILTGVPVFVTAANFVLEEGGKVAASGQGYGWELLAGSLPPGAIQDNDGYTFTPGRGCSYSKGAAYGANSSSGSAKAYGYAYAPWLPGSPNGLYNKYASYPTGLNLPGWARGGGAARIHATAQMSLAGWIDCNGHYRFYGAPSGGGIWLTSPAFLIFRTARLTAEGGDCASNYGTGSAGTGGRISLGAGLTDEEISGLATGRPPASLNLVYGTPTFIDTSVLGGSSPTLTLINAENCARQYSGTSTYTLNTNAAVALAVVAEGVEGAEAVNGNAFVQAGQQATFGVETFKTVADARSHFIASSWTVTNALGEVVASGTGGTASFTPELGATRLGLTWTLAAIEDEVELYIVGDGSVATNGVAASHGTLSLVRGTTVQLAASPASGSIFGMWHTDVSSAYAFDASWSFNVTEPCRLTAHFDSAQLKTYVGASGGAWEEASNWSPDGVPGIADAVSIGNTTVMATSEIFAASLSLAPGGILVIGGGTADVLAQTPTNGTAFGLNIAGDAMLSGNLSIGGKGSSVPVSMTIGGALLLDNDARLVIYATPASDFAFGTLYDEATTVCVDGSVTLLDHARIVPDADPVTGAPVHFRVGSVSVGVDAAFDADARGYGWTTFYGELPYFVRAFWPGDQTVLSTKSCSYAPGGGGGDGQNDRGAGYGGTGDRGGWLAGRAYGYRYAPFLPGSCGRSGGYGGGSVWIDCAGQFSLHGTISACGTNNAARTSNSSGGGIWISARGFTAGSESRLLAPGGSTPGFGYGSAGGRVSLILGATEDERAALATGATPDTLTYEDAITLVPTDVSGGKGARVSDTSYYTASDGTASLVRGTETGTMVYITGSPVEAISDGTIYGTLVAEVGQSITFSASVYGFNPTNDAIRYACNGFLATNANGVIRARGTGTSATFEVQDEETYFTWIWGNSMTQVQIDLDEGAGGSVAVDGSTHADTFREWIGETGASFTAQPASGYEFLYWVGAVPAGHETDNPLAISRDRFRRLAPVFRPIAAAATRIWQGGTGAWTDPTKWSGGNIPGLADSVEIASGTCLVSNYAECASVTLSGTAKLLVGAYQKAANAEKSILAVYPAQHILPYAGTGIEVARLRVREMLSACETAEVAIGAQDQPYFTRFDARSVHLDDSAKMMVTAGPLDGVFTHATGSGFFNLAGSFLLAGSSRFYPVCDGYTGGPVVCHVEHLAVATNAAVSADDFGYAIRLDNTPQTLSPGLVTGYGKGCGHGGYGSSHTATYGNIYDFLYAPVQPGSCAGPVYSDSAKNSPPGGGVIRIHARTADLAGMLTAESATYSHYTAGSGGSIWVTASKQIRIRPGAVIRARGRSMGYGGGSGGGRVSIGRGLSGDEVASLVADGDAIPLRTTGKPIMAHDAAVFAELFPGVTTSVEKVSGNATDGTFVFLDGGIKNGTILLMR